MDATVLIDAVVRQTTVLIAQLATAAGGRATLANTANRVFLDLVSELKAQGLGNKVIADMFGLALRTYQDKVRRLAESTTERGKSLWEAALEFVREEGTVTQYDVLERFKHDDDVMVRGVLTDLVDSGLVFRSGRGAHAKFRALDAAELLAGPGVSREAAAALVWVAVCRFGPASSSEIAEAVPLDSVELEEALAELVGDGRVQRIDREGVPHYRTDLCWLPLGTSAGWEGAVFDHYQAVVTTICSKLRGGSPVPTVGDSEGGSTFALTVWKGHPEYDAVLGHLGRLRAETIALRERVTAHNREHAPLDGAIRVISYIGQSVVEIGGSEQDP